MKPWSFKIAIFSFNFRKITIVKKHRFLVIKRRVEFVKKHRMRFTNIQKDKSASFSVTSASCKQVSSYSFVISGASNLHPTERNILSEY